MSVLEQTKPMHEINSVYENENENEVVHPSIRSVAQWGCFTNSLWMVGALICLNGVPSFGFHIEFQKWSLLQSLLQESF